tara:strand:+ start:816 stop:1514 length:699 start_codon:yes stop_codon:yes gene_type:complete
MKKSILFFKWISIFGLLSCGVWIFLFTPVEINQGYPQKIMYLHVPTVIITYLAFFVVFAFSIAYLWKRDLMYDQIAKSSAEIGLIFCSLVLITGAIWGKPTWGTYWVWWDIRLLTTLLLFLIFLGYFILRKAINDRDKEARLAAVLGIIGCLDIPIIHKSIEWARGRTLHQPTTFLKVENEKINPSISDSLMSPLTFTIFFILFFYIYLMLIRYQNEKREQRLYELLAKTIN